MFGSGIVDECLEKLSRPLGLVVMDAPAGPGGPRSNASRRARAGAGHVRAQLRQHEASEDAIFTVGPYTFRPRSKLFLNPDGSRAGQCGNGARCVALFLELTEGYDGSYTAEGPSGNVGISRCDDGEYELDMGEPDFNPVAVPVDLPAKDDLYHLNSPWGRLEFGAVSMGNPHALVQVDDIDDDRLPIMGIWLQAQEAFPDRVNAGFAQVLDRESIRLRVVERGLGETLACGSGACAAVAVLARRGLLDERVAVFVPGSESAARSSLEPLRERRGMACSARSSCTSGGLPCR